MKINDVIELVYSARQSGIDILVNDGRLQLKVPKESTVSKELLDNIRSRKEQIIDLLQNDKWRAGRPEGNERIGRRERKDKPGKIPLSFSQERLWVVDQVEGGSVPYHSSIVLRIRGVLDENAVQFSLQSVVDRHEVLRTVIVPEDGVPFQRILPEGGWRLVISDRRDIREDVEAIRGAVEQLINAPFDLSRDHLLRGELMRMDDEEWLLVIVLHHIASDGWSTGILVREFSEFYSARVGRRPVALEPLPIQYADYAIWQRDHISDESLAARLAYWKEQLSGIEPLNLPLKPGNMIRQGAEGERVSLMIDRDLTDQVVGFARSEGLTLYMFLLGVLKMVLYRYTGQEDIAVGTSLAGRQQQEVEGLIGFFSNTIVLRSRVEGRMTVRELLHSVKQTALEGYANQEAPFDRVVEALHVKREMGQNPLFQVMFVLENVPGTGERKALPGISFSPEDLGVVKAKFDLTLSVVQMPRGMSLSLTYRKDLFAGETMEQLLTHYERLLKLSISSPGQLVGALPMVSEEELAAPIAAAGREAVDAPLQKTVGVLFEEQAMLTPDAAALAFMGETLTYEELNTRADQLAHFLKEKGVGAGQPVPICVERTEKMIIGFLGIIKAGGAYVPIDPEYPDERIGYILADVGSGIVVADKGSHARMLRNAIPTIVDLDGDWEEITGRPAAGPDAGRLHADGVVAAATPDQPVYVIYTSGSTGLPKGVVITHRNVIDYVWGIRRRLEMESGLSFAWMSTIAADLGNTVIFWSLLSGGNLHIFPGWLLKDAAGLHDYFRRHRIDCVKIVPSHWAALSIDGTCLMPKKLLIFGGEALPPQLLNVIPPEAASCRIVNHYGPTETTIGKLLHVVEAEDAYRRSIPLGRPFSNTDVCLLTREGAYCPPGAPGEICIGGDGVGAGYLNQAELTMEKFVWHRTATGMARRIYRTGDLGRRLSNGEIEFLGRKDHQVKIRGFRVELGEVESILRSHPQVRQCAVLDKDDELGYKQLLAFVVPGEGYDRMEFTAWFSGRLPEPMRPSGVMELEQLPLTSNGKIDRKVLATMELAVPADQEYVAPRTATEIALAAIWQELLGVDQVGSKDNFFDLGGHSLLAIRVITSIRRQLAIEISIGDIFDHPTIAALAQQLDARSNKTSLPPLGRQKRPAFIPLSFSQERLWFIDRLEGSRQYHIPWVLRLQGEVDEGLLGDALRGVIARHEVLRTMILEEGGQPYQAIREATDWKLEVVDVPEGSVAHRPEEPNESAHPREYIREWISRPFDLATDHKLRARLLRLGGGEYLLVLVLHHIASDGWSHGILVKEFTELYSAMVEGRTPVLDPLAIQYADHALWQRQYLRGELLEKKLAWWKDTLAECRPLELPADAPRPMTPSRQGAVLSFRIEKELSEQVQALAQREGATVFMTLLAVFQVLLYRYSGHEDFCVGTPVANRMQHEVEGLIGFFVNTLVLRSRLEGNPTFLELLRRVKKGTMGAFEHQDVPFEKVVEAVVRERDMSRPPLFQVLFQMQNSGPGSDIINKGLPGVRISLGPLGAVMLKFDLTFTVAEGSEGMHGTIEYSTELYEARRMERMAGHFIKLLRGVVGEPGKKIGELALLPPEEREQLLKASGCMGSANASTNGSVVGSINGRDDTFIGMFEQQVARTPEALAVVCGDEKLTYRDLDSRANALAHRLRSRGVREESLVGICIHRSVEMLVSILGIFKAGGAYVPLDPEYPEVRMRWILEDTGISVVVRSDECHGTQPSAPHRELAGHHLAYVIYTSGSTGRPKGVMIEQHSLVNYLLNSECGYIPEDREATDAGAGSFVHLSYTFDASLTGLLLPLVRGRAVVISSAPAADVFSDPLFFQYAPYDFIKLTPAHLALLEQLPGGADPIMASRRWVLGGEALHAGQLRPWTERGIAAEIINEYGPTEATVGCSVFRVNTTMTIEDKANGLSIGRPIGNAWMYILDQHGELVPTGVAGEICIGGEGLARGYLNRPELTAERFVEDVFSGRPGARIYRTGDLGRWTADGNIEYLGRNDDQVKIRGYRVELGEIEAVLGQYGNVEQPVVLAVPAGADSRRLVAYLVAGDGFDEAAVMADLKTRLPEYMLPSQLVALERMPLTSHGKIDRTALAEMGVAVSSPDEYIAPRTEIERTLTDLWQELLGVERIGIRDNFFRLGGHSLLALRLIARLQADYRVVINDLFRHPTIEGLAGCITYEKNYLENKLQALVARLKEQGHQGIKEQDRQGSENIRAWDARLAAEKAGYLARIGAARPIDGNDRLPYGQILLLGATGFLGMHLLHELLHRHEGTVVVVVRGSSDEQAYRRLKERYGFYFGGSPDGFGARLRVLAGDLTHDRFGLDVDRYNELADQTDCVLNTAANVKHYGDLDDFLKVNTRPVGTLVEFCRTGKQKVIHHVSTLSICGNRFDEDSFLFTETDLEKGKAKTNFYVQSKLEAEKALQAARDAGVTVNIYRVGNLCFHSATGKFQENIEDNAFYTQLKGFLTFGVAPAEFGQLRMSHIDQVAAAILTLFDQKQLLNKNFHVQNPAILTIADFAEYATEAGYPIKVTGLAGLAQRALEHYPSNKELVNRLLLHFDIFGEQEQRGKTYQVCSEQTDDLLARLQFQWKPIDREGIALMLDHGAGVRYFPRL